VILQSGSNPNVENRMTKETRNPNDQKIGRWGPRRLFDIRALGFIRHFGFVIRHYGSTWRQIAGPVI